jgi:hypothetical protein
MAEQRMQEQVTTIRPIYAIAREISASWRKVDLAARPYLDAMSSMTTLTQDVAGREMACRYGAERCDDVVLRFLSNAGNWRGETARRVKMELNEMLKTMKDVP